MANALQLRRGTTTQHNTFTGLAGEVTVDTDKETVVVHDGSTAGGFPLARASDLTNFDADTLDGKQLATIESEYQAFANTAAANVVDSAPGTLDTLNELAAALGDDPNFATTVTNSIATKMPLAGGTFTGDVSFGDNDKAIFGAGSDLQIYHDSASGQSIIHENGPGVLKIRASDLRLSNAANTADYLSANDGAEVSIRYNGSTKLETTSYGTLFTGNSKWADNGKATFGAGDDLQIYHSGSDNNSYIEEIGSGSLVIAADQLYIQNAAKSETKALFTTDGGVSLRHNDATKFTTTTTGVDISGTAVTDGVTVDGTLDIEEVYEKVQTSVGTSGLIGFETDQFGVLYYTANQTANRTINFQNVNSNLAIGQSVTCTALMTQGSTAYYLNTYQVDGTAVTPKWSGGSAPTGGNASGIDVYTFTIIKTANATFTVLASQTQYA